MESEDASDLLPDMDILITDYSSVYIDYLLTGKPLIFAPFDLKEYLHNDKELYYSYEQVTPGPKCKNWKDVLKWVEKYNDETLFSSDRSLLRDSFHKYTDSRSSERVYSEILHLINNADI